MNNSWDVLLIGGSAGVGKSHLARQLGEHFKVPSVEIDDIRIALQTLVDKSRYPDLFMFVDTKDYLSSFDEHLFTEKLLKVGKVLWKPLQTIIGKHLSHSEKVIFEGDSILPKLVASMDRSRIATLFLYDERDALRARQLERNRHGEAAQKVEKNSLFSYTYGQEIRRQAEEYNMTVISASPIETLFQRSLEHLG